jgi:hypothetical protein
VNVNAGCNLHGFSCQGHREMDKMQSTPIGALCAFGLPSLSLPAKVTAADTFTMRLNQFNPANSLFGIVARRFSEAIRR